MSEGLSREHEYDWRRTDRQTDRPQHVEMCKKVGEIASPISCKTNNTDKIRVKSFIKAIPVLGPECFLKSYLSTSLYHWSATCWPNSAHHNRSSVGQLNLQVQSYKSQPNVIPRLHDRADIEQTSSWLVPLTWYSQLVEPAWSCKRGI